MSKHICWTDDTVCNTCGNPCPDCCIDCPPVFTLTNGLEEQP